MPPEYLQDHLDTIPHLDIDVFPQVIHVLRLQLLVEENHLGQATPHSFPYLFKLRLAQPTWSEPTYINCIDDPIASLLRQDPKLPKVIPIRHDGYCPYEHHPPYCSSLPRRSPKVIESSPPDEYITFSSLGSASSTSFTESSFSSFLRTGSSGTIFPCSTFLI